MSPPETMSPPKKKKNSKQQTPPPQPPTLNDVQHKVKTHSREDVGSGLDFFFSGFWGIFTAISVETVKVLVFLFPDFLFLFCISLNSASKQFCRNIFCLNDFLKQKLWMRQSGGVGDVTPAHEYLNYKYSPWYCLFSCSSTFWWTASVPVQYYWKPLGHTFSLYMEQIHPFLVS